MTAPVRPRRVDAVRNAEKVLEAARDVFAEQGLDANIDEVAARAGVGKATVYRSYPTKEELVAAVVGARLDAFTALAREAAASDDPWAAFVELLRQSARSAAGNALLEAGLANPTEGEELKAKRVACLEAIQACLDASVTQGRARVDVTAREVTVLMCGAYRTLKAEGVTDLDEWTRYADLVLRVTAL